MNSNVILNNGGGWITNIGNAFLDIGSCESLRQALPETNISLASVMNRWVSHHTELGVVGRVTHRKSNLGNVFNLQDYSRADFVVQSGACLGKPWFDVHGSLLERLSSRGVKIVINGGGMTENEYSDEKIDTTRRYLQRLNPFVFISRDRESYDRLADIAEHAYNGIDCAFFVSDCHRPAPLTITDYVVLNFDKGPEPPLNELPVSGRTVVRTHHSFWHNFKAVDYASMFREYYRKANTMISEIPDDYLNLYANASLVVSDRVHACVATLAFGGTAQLYSDSPRARLLERVGATNIKHDPTAIDIGKLKEEKSKQVRFLSEVLS